MRKFWQAIFLCHLKVDEISFLSFVSVSFVQCSYYCNLLFLKLRKYSVFVTKSSFGLESANQLAFAVFRVTQVVFFWAAFAFSTKCVTGKPTMKKQVVFLPGLCSFNITSRIWLSGRALNLWLEGHGADPWQENCFLLQSRLCVQTLTAVSIPPLRYHSST